MSRLSIEISPEQHKKIKALAALKGQSIKDFILEKLFSPNEENEKTAITELEELLLARINLAKDSPSSYKSFQQITDSVLKKEES